MGKLPGMERTQLAAHPGEATGPRGEEQKTAGDFSISYRTGPAEGFYEFSDGMLEWKEPQDQNVHLDVLVCDARDGRMIPGLNVQGALLDMRGGRAAAAHLPFVWHPQQNHYGANVKIPKGGRYVLQVHVDPATFVRRGKEEGKRYVTGADVTFEDVQIEI